MSESQQSTESTEQQASLLREAFVKAEERAAKAEQERDEAVARLSHFIGEPLTNDFAQFGFDDSTPLPERVENIREALCRSMHAFNPDCSVALSNKEKWAFVLSGGIIDGLTSERDRLAAENEWLKHLARKDTPSDIGL